MSAHGEQPFVSVHDTNGNPVVAAKLYVYQVGTTTLRPIYSNAALSTPLSNPLTSDAAGNFARFYQASGTYKLRVETSASVLIWEYDNIDTGIASGNPLAVANGGTGATTAAGARTNLGVPSQSEVDDLAESVSDIANSVQNVIGFPQGYLTLTSGTPIINASVSAGTSVYYTPLIGTQVPVYNGTSFGVKVFTEITLALDTNHVANNIYDVFVIDDNGTLRLVTGPAWNVSTLGSGDRGTGAGTTELERLSGLWVNKNSATMRYGATTLSVAARLGTYVGSILIDGSNGQVTCHRAYGQSRKWGVWNAYNRQPIKLKAGDATASWTYNSGTYRASRNDATNCITTLQGLREELIALRVFQAVSQITNNGAAALGVGANSTSSPIGYTVSITVLAGCTVHLEANYLDVNLTLGGMKYTALEASTGTVTTTFNGTENSMQLIAEYRA